MAFTPITTQATLLNNLAQVRDWAINPRQRKALQVYCRTRTLKQLGGTDYTAALPTLVNDTAALLNGIYGSDLEAAKAACDYNEARFALAGLTISAGAGTAMSTDLATLKTATSAIAAYPEDTLDRMLLLLRYAICQLV